MPLPLCRIIIQTHTHIRTRMLYNQKTFAPTIPTNRRIKKDSSDLQQSSSSTQPSHQKSPKGKKRSHDKRKGKRGEKHVITSSSVFSMGPSDQRRGEYVLLILFHLYHVLVSIVIYWSSLVTFKVFVIQFVVTAD